MAVQNVFLVVWRLNEVGGAEQHVTELAIALALSGVRVTLLSQLPLPVSTEFEARLVADGVKVVAPRAVPRLFWGLRAPRIWLRRSWNRLRRARSRQPSSEGASGRAGIRHAGSRSRLLAAISRESRHGRPDVVHVHGYRADQSWLLPWLDSRGYPSVYTDHGNLDAAPLATGAIEHANLRRATRLLAVSDATARALGSGLPGAYPVGIASHIVRAPAAGPPPGDRTTVELLFVGRVVRLKGLAELLDAFERLLIDGLSVHLTLAGDGPDRLTFESRAAHLGQAVTFAGVVKRSELDSLLAAADIAVLPSHLEAMPVALLEQMGASKAIVATTVGGIPEVLQHERDALLVAPGDTNALAAALKRLALSPEERASLGENARRRFDALHLDPASVAEGTSRLYAAAAAERDGRKRRLLLICNVPPYPPRSGVQLRLWSIIERLRDEFDLTIACHTRSPEDIAAVAALNEQGVRSISGPLDRRQRGRRMVKALLRGRAPELGIWHAPGLASRLRDLARTDGFDAIQVEETMLVPYLDFFPHSAAPRRFLTLHNVRFDQMTKLAAINRRWQVRAWHRLNAALTKRYEQGLASSFDRVFVVSERDRDLVARGTHRNRFLVVPNGVDTRPGPLPPPPPGAGPRLVFVGHMGYTPCADGACWFANEILPLVLEGEPAATFAVVGASPAHRVRALSSATVTVTGTVPDVAPYYAGADIVVAPLRAGGGSRLKILEAMAFGRPVISTTVGAEGLNVRDGEHLLLADTPKEFAVAVHRLRQQPELAAQLMLAARRLAETEYDWDGIAAIQAAAYRQTFSEPLR